MNWIEFLRKDIQTDLIEMFGSANEYTVMSYLKALDKGMSLSTNDKSKIKDFINACNIVLNGQFNITHFKFYYEDVMPPAFLYVYCCGVEVDEDTDFDFLEKELQEFLETDEVEENCWSFQIKVF